MIETTNNIIFFTGYVAVFLVLILIIAFTLDRLLKMPRSILYSMLMRENKKNHKSLRRFLKYIINKEK